MIENITTNTVGLTTPGSGVNLNEIEPCSLDEAMALAKEVSGELLAHFFMLYRWKRNKLAKKLIRMSSS